MRKSLVIVLAAACLTWPGCRREDETENVPQPTPAQPEQAPAKKPPEPAANPPSSAGADRRAVTEPEPSEPSKEAGKPVADGGDSPAGTTTEIERKEGRKRTAIKLPPETLDRYVGYYMMRPGLFLHVTRIEDQLYVQVTGRDMYPVYAEDTTRFFYAATAADIVFALDESGAASTLTLEMPTGSSQAKKMPPDFQPPAPKREVPVDPSILERYVGRYEIHDQKHVDITLEEGNLYAQVTDQPRFQIYPESETRFFYKVFDVAISFAARPDGEVVALTIHDNKVESVAKKVD